MKSFRTIKTLPSEENFVIFKELPQKLYPKDSQRFLLGNEPVIEHLEGCYVLFKNEIPIARCAFYMNPKLQLDGKSTACIGSFECENNFESAEFLLKSIVEIARQKDVQILIGPMEGSTWENYRFSLDNSTPNFFMEPYNHEYYPTFFEKFGFNIFGSYFSNKDLLMEINKDELKRFEEKLEQNNGIARFLDVENLASELEKIAHFNNEVFKENNLFTPINPEKFVEKYMGMKKYLRPDFIRIIEDEKEQIHAILFSIEDFFNQNEKTLIVKSIARRKDSPFRGSTGYLGQKTYEVAKKEGFQNVIHAYFHEENESSTVSERYGGKRFKSYRLYSYEL